jgi:hypothetical protein
MQRNVNDESDIVVAVERRNRCKETSGPAARGAYEQNVRRLSPLR